MTMTLNSFAFALGGNTRMTQEHSLVWHKAWLKATPETRSAWRAEWVENFVAGFKAASSKRCTQEDLRGAANAAQQKWKYHIARDSAKLSSRKAEPTKVRVSAVERAAYEAFVKACGSVERAAVVFKALSSR
jgi:hypothetical protein